MTVFPPGIHLWKYFCRTFNMMLGIAMPNRWIAGEFTSGNRGRLSHHPAIERMGSLTSSIQGIAPSETRTPPFFIFWDAIQLLGFPYLQNPPFFFWDAMDENPRMPVCALVNEKIFCVHGGISPELQNLDQIRQLERRGRRLRRGGSKILCPMSYGRYIMLHHVISWSFLNVFVHQMIISMFCTRLCFVANTRLLVMSTYI